jgi:hypothetical protein
LHPRQVGRAAEGRRTPIHHRNASNLPK